MSTKNVLIVGAGGFIGGFIAAESLRRGYSTWCAVRASTSRRYLRDPRLRFVELDFDRPDAVAAALAAAAPAGGRWDWVVYNLGATKCISFTDFNRINYGCLRTFCEALEASDTMPRRLLYISSLSALGPGDERGYTPLDDNTPPAPNTRYGLSKIKAEGYLQAHPAVPWIILRPTGVYGPHEQDYLMMVKCIDRHIDFSVGFRRQELTFIYVEDLARAIFDALDRSAPHRTYIVSEQRSYTQADFRRIVARALGRRWVVPVRLPLWAVAAVSAVAGKIGVMRMRPSTLNTDKYRIMRQRNWSCDTSAAVSGFGFAPRVPLEEGIARVVDAWRSQCRQEAASR